MKETPLGNCTSVEIKTLESNVSLLNCFVLHYTLWKQLTFFTCTDPPTHCWTQFFFKKTYVLPSLSLYILYVLSSFSLSSQLSSMTGHSRTASRSWSVSLQHSPSLCYLFLSASPLSSWPYLPLHICALVCALRLFIHIRTETHPDTYLSALCRIHSTRHPANGIRKRRGPSFFLSMSKWLKCKYAYIFPVFSVSCPYGDATVNPTWSEWRGALGGRDR